VVDQMW